MIKVATSKFLIAIERGQRPSPGGLARVPDPIDEQWWHRDLYQTELNKIRRQQWEDRMRWADQ